MLINKVRDKLGSLCIIYSLGQVKFQLDKYIMVIYLSLGKYKILLFSQPLVYTTVKSRLSERPLSETTGLFK